MKLTLWTYEGPPHVGAMRVAASMRGVHYLLHAPQGDTYADLLFTMIERNDQRPPVSYTTFQARDLGGDTAEIVKRAISAAAERFQPELLLVGESCTAELIQDMPGALAEGMQNLPPVVPLELPAYSRKENWGASETLYQIVRAVLKDRVGEPRSGNEAGRPRANVIGPASLAFRARDDAREIRELLAEAGVDVHVTLPAGASAADVASLPDADFNVCLYPELAEPTCRWLEKNFEMPWTRSVPIGIAGTQAFLAEIAELTGQQSAPTPAKARLPWYSRSIDSNYLTGKRVFIFGDATHACAAARIAARELAFEVVGIGTYAREHARAVRECARELGVEPLITDDYLAVEAAVTELAPELVLGTQMERHIAKRLGIPCAVISAPFHVQDCPARYSPQVGWEGANVIFDSWVHPLMMGLEEHLLGMFRDDFEFNDHAPSHLAAEGEQTAASAAAVTEAAAPMEAAALAAAPEPATAAADADCVWAPDAEAELKKIPFFVRGKARNNTVRFARERGVHTITLETLYDAKAHFAR